MKRTLSVKFYEYIMSSCANALLVIADIYTVRHFFISHAFNDPRRAPGGFFKSTTLERRFVIDINVQSIANLQLLPRKVQFYRILRDGLSHFGILR